MSSSLHSFIAASKHNLQKPPNSDKSKTAFVIGNESADLDSIISAVVYGFLSPSPTTPIANILSSDLALRPELAALFKHADIEVKDLVTLDNLHNLPPPGDTEWTLVDHNAFQGSLGNRYSKDVVGLIDHHVDEEKVPSSAKPRIIEKAGSCTSLVVNFCRPNWGKGDAKTAMIALGPILIDTHNMQSKDKVTDHDREAVEFLEGKLSGQNFDRDAFFAEINNAKTNLDGMDLNGILRKDYKQWIVGDFTFGISSVVKPISYLETKAEKMIESMKSFANDRDLDIYAVMTAYTNVQGEFVRELLLISLNDGKAMEKVKKIAEMGSTELQLEESGTKIANSCVPWVRVWRQKNVEASRKKVAPLMRKALGAGF
ncbi:DHH phosphoesterase [Piedraia hortae CBS 480.64]|uniref:DHH phosphoesterase n=1 Tax=Piedraia hortae CBS 480.64 TaxID=1314780 RepID=A0A6A7C6U5_9PEZI|nr:DHH phosphoesterase [Piedraia hortae CBS 480.64]